MFVARKWSRNVTVVHRLKIILCFRPLQRSTGRQYHDGCNKSRTERAKTKLWDEIAGPKGGTIVELQKATPVE